MMLSLLAMEFIPLLLLERYIAQPLPQLSIFLSHTQFTYLLLNQSIMRLDQPLSLLTGVHMEDLETHLNLDFDLADLINLPQCNMADVVLGNTAYKLEAMNSLIIRPT